jgi:ribonucleoside-diphosphate reductase alpha chain
MPDKLKRDKILKGETTEVTVGCGHLYVVVNKDKDTKQPIEVFASLGKSGSCSKCQMEALTRCISTGLRYGIPVDEFHKQLQGIACPEPSFNGGKDGKILSCPDAISRVLKDYIKEELI